MPHVSKGNKIKIIKTHAFLWIIILTINHNLASVPGVLKSKLGILKVHLSRELGICSRDALVWKEIW